MEFRDLKKQYELHKREIDLSIQKVLESTHFISGQQVTELEENLAAYVSKKYCIACANGTDALQLALMAWEIGVGDAVFVPDFTFFSSGEVVSLVGATPIFVDVDADTYNIDCDSLEKAICYVLENTDLVPKVIIAVDLFGQPADYDRIRQIARKYNLLILEDAAQGFGGTFGEARACSFGDISTTSFFPAKPLGCYGDGGAVFTDNEEWAGKIKSLHVHGKGSDKYDNIRIGLNSRLDTLQAAILLEKMKFFDQEIEMCNQVADVYTELLSNIVKTPVIGVRMKSSWAQYTIQLKDQEERSRVMEGLKKDGIPSAVYYKKPMHCQQAFAAKLVEAVPCNNTEAICQRCLSLPMHPYLERHASMMICDSVKRIVFDGDSI